MASEYLKWKYKDVKPEEKREMTKAEKRKNWWYYHKRHIAVALVAASLLGSLLWQALSRVDPDYKVGYVGSFPLPEETSAALEAAFAALGEDLNGDGQVVVQISQYTSPSSMDMGEAAVSEVKLIADITEGESYIFLLEDPESFQRRYHTLCRLDGSLPEEDDDSIDGVCLSWGQCPVLAGLELGGYTYELPDESAAGDSQELLSGLYVARRGFWTEKPAPLFEGSEALWNRLTEGAVS